MIHDHTAKQLISRNSNLMVPWYLMASFTYEHLNDIILTDGFYDNLCKELYDKWDDIEHRHKGCIDKEALLAGTGCMIKEYPEITKSAAKRLKEEQDDYEI